MSCMHPSRQSDKIVIRSKSVIHSYLGKQFLSKIIGFLQFIQETNKLFSCSYVLNSGEKILKVDSYLKGPKTSNSQELPCLQVRS